MGRGRRFVVQALVWVALSACLPAAAEAMAVPSPAASAHVAKFTPTEFLQQIADTYIPIYESDLHHPLGLTVVAGELDHEVKDMDGNLIYADATALNAEGSDTGPGDPVKCRIRETPLGLSKGTPFVTLTIAHELFHCFQFDLRGKDAWKKMPLWVQEGTADWAATTVDPSAFDLDNNFLELGKYLGHPRTELFDRSYDASGFWGHVQDVTGDLWKVLPAVIRAADSRAAFVAAGADDGAVLNTWASSYLRNPTGNASEAWQMHSPMVPPDSNQDQLDSLPEPVLQLTGPSKVWAHSYSVVDYHFASMPSGEPLMHVVLHGYGRLSVEHNYTHLSNAWFCVDPQGCKCPPDTTDELPATQPLETDAYLGVTGDPDDPSGTEGMITFHKLDDFCKPKQPPYHKGNAGSGGDPHLNTFDGEFYDFQAAGEFTLMKSTRSDLEIQVRQRAANLFGGHVALITAVAVRDGGATIEVDANGTTYLDKRRTTFSTAPRRLPGGGSVRTAYGTIVRWRDGTSAEIFPGGSIGMAVTAHAARDIKHHLEGLWGPYSGGKPASDFVGRSRKRYRVLGGRYGVPSFGALYGEFGNSWRITQKQSLFVYPRGKNTHSYTRLRYPPNPVGLGRLSPAALAKAKAVCLAAGIKLPGVLADCELDVGLTGNDGYAAGDQHLQAAAQGNPVPPAGALRSRIPWTQLSSQPGQTINGGPSIAVAGGQVVAAYENGNGTDVEASTFTAGAAGVSGISRAPVFSGWQQPGNPLLIGGPGGTLQAVMAGMHGGGGDPLNGTVIARRAANGSFGPPSTLSGTITCCTTSAVVAADGSTPLWAASPDYNLLVFSGSTENDLTAHAPSDAVGDGFPALGRDTSGRAWLAWYTFSQSQGSTGLYLMQINPQTGASAGPAMLVPDSDNGPQFGLHIGLACAQTCRIVYSPLSNSEEVVSWAPGEKTPTKVFSGLIGDHPQSPDDVRAAYTADGRLWVIWYDQESRLEYASLGDSRGAGGQPIALPAVHGYSAPADSVPATVGTRLVLASEWGNDNAHVNAVFGTVVNPPQ